MTRLILCLCFGVFSNAIAAPLPIGNGSVVGLVEDTVSTTMIAACSDKTEQGKTEAARDVAACPRVRIEWLNQMPEPTQFVIEPPQPQKQQNVITSSHRLGRTGITRTFLVTDEAMFLHVVADQPGAISFKATLLAPEEGSAVIRDRNEILWTGAGDRKARAYVRVVPFESDVEADGGSIVLRGEGECLVVFQFSPSDDAGNPVSDTWKRLCARLDPGAEHADPVKIWHALLGEVTKVPEGR